tara:strand:+ start:941 stop:1381 length:441 start_codon:yes stop_codon:yes gene_type:complete
MDTNVPGVEAFNFKSINFSKLTAEQLYDNEELKYLVKVEDESDSPIKLSIDVLDIIPILINSIIKNTEDNEEIADKQKEISSRYESKIIELESRIKNLENEIIRVNSLSLQCNVITKEIRKTKKDLEERHQKDKLILLKSMKRQKK